jgi:hypothetical protein
MQHTPVNSSMLSAIGYDPSTQTLEAQFAKGGLYRYTEVPPEVHAEMMAAESVGSYFLRNVRSKFSGSKVDPEEVK